MRRRNWKIAATLTGVILTVILLRSCVATSYLIPSTGMENSLYRGERILVNKWSYGLRLPFISLWGYHRWGDKPVRKDDILVFNNPANLSQTAIDQREVYIGRCLGVPGDTLWVDSLFSVIPSEKNAPDQKFLYTYPRKKEKQLDSLLTILSIRPNVLLGQDTVKNVRSFSRYEYYLLEQALGTNNWIEPADKEDSVDVLKPLIIPGKGKAVRVYPWNITLEGFFHTDKFFTDTFQPLYDFKIPESGFLIVFHALACAGQRHAALLDQMINQLHRFNIFLTVLAYPPPAFLRSELWKLLLPETQQRFVDIEHSGNLADGVI